MYKINFVVQRMTVVFNSTFMCYFQVSSVKPTAHVENHYTVMVIIQAFLQQET